MRAKQTSRIVEAILMKYPHTRSSDTELIIGTLQALGANLSQEQRDIIRSVNFESVRRHRQLLQADGKFLPTAEVAEQRKQKASMVRDAAGSGNSSLLEELLNKPNPDWMDGIGGSV